MKIKTPIEKFCFVLTPNMPPVTCLHRRLLLAQKMGSTIMLNLPPKSHFPEEKKFQLDLPALMTIPSGQREEEIDRRIVKGFDNYRGIVNQHIEKGIVIVNQNYKRRLSWSADKKQGMQLN